ncbi:MAG: phage virion morphogenesis protein [Thalassobium sp.]|nr:MAG: phage virion morphogenesis protein [Thalassobium sp.]
MSVKVLINDYQIRPALEALHDAMGNTDPALRQIGEYLVGSTKERFRTTTAPDGSQWAANKDTTLDNYTNRFKTSFTKTGRRSKAGRERRANKKPGTGETRQLQTQIYYNVRNGELEVGSPLIYAGTFQRGAKKGQYGKGAPWGDVPAREFLGLSEADEREVMAIIEDHLRNE